MISRLTSTKPHSDTWTPNGDARFTIPMRGSRIMEAFQESPPHPSPLPVGWGEVSAGRVRGIPLRASSQRAFEDSSRLLMDSIVLPRFLHQQAVVNGSGARRKGRSPSQDFRGQKCPRICLGERTHTCT
jgi:hypothetical protein